jgi:hypothetical protein
MSALDRGLRGFFGVLTAAPCFVLAATLMLTWIDPMSINQGKWVRFGVGIMVLEFVLVHSGAMMSSWQRSKEPGQWKAFLVIFGFYALFAGAMAAAFKSWELFLLFSVVMATRWMTMLTDPQHAPEVAMRRSGLSVLFYLFAVFCSIFIAIPELGMSVSVVRDVYPDRGSGAWERDPERALAAGVIYFSLLGVAELVAGFRAPRPAAESPVAQGD